MRREILAAQEKLLRAHREISHQFVECAFEYHPHRNAFRVLVPQFARKLDAFEWVIDGKDAIDVDASIYVDVTRVFGERGAVARDELNARKVEVEQVIVRKSAEVRTV